ncbi:NAD(P)-dependent oxidoreductase [Aeoliella sp.]|uniref:NAD(P)-dependent oxidoreductase n=1 Tax=Aeoliella sp. TaxID=2795800 RepID=UPI003CCB78CB
MTTLIVGASGATGQLLVEQLLQRDQQVRAIVRSPQSMPSRLVESPRLTLIQANLLELSSDQLAGHLAGCDAVASCLGHRLSFGGIFGPPYRLVTEAVRRSCQAIKANAAPRPVKFVLMNTTGNRNRDQDVPRSVAEECVIGALRLLVPPHADNEQAAEFLKTEIGPGDAAIEWAVVRPDALTNDEQVTRYDLHPSPIRSAIFNAGKTSRVNVAHFMAELITKQETWDDWKGQMPVIYNTE